MGSPSLSLSPLTIITIIYRHHPPCCIFCQQVKLPFCKDMSSIYSWLIFLFHSWLSFPFPRFHTPLTTGPLEWNDSKISTLQSVSQSPCSRSVQHNLSLSCLASLLPHSIDVRRGIIYLYRQTSFIFVIFNKLVRKK